MERTLVIVKPHGVEKGLTGRILTRFEEMGLEIADIKLLRGTPDLWESFYPADNIWFTNAGTKTLESCKASGIDVEKELGTSDPLAIGKMIKSWLVEHMSSGPAIAVVLQGNEVSRKVRKACGKTLPNVADPGTIRFDYSCDSPALANREKRPVFNVVHASDPDEEGSIEKEIRLIFGNE